METAIFSPRSDFVYRPYAVGEPYGTAHVAHFDLADLAEGEQRQQQGEGGGQHVSALRP